MVFPTPNSPWLPTVVCAGLRPCGLLPVQFGKPVGVTLVQLMSGQSCWPDFMGMAPDVTKRHNLTSNSLLLQSFCPISAMVSEPLVQKLFYGYICWDWAPQLCILIGFSFL